MGTKRTRASAVQQKKIIIINSNENSIEPVRGSFAQPILKHKKNTEININPFSMYRSTLHAPSRHDYSSKEIHQGIKAKSKSKNIIPIDIEERLNKSDDIHIKQRKSIRYSKYLYVFQENEKSDKLKKVKKKISNMKLRKNECDFELNDYILFSDQNKKSFIAGNIKNDN